MKWFLYGVLLLLLSLGLVVLRTPLSFVMEKTTGANPAITYASASGTVWDGRVNALKYGVQTIGNVEIATDLPSALLGQIKTSLSLRDGAVTSMGTLKAGLDGRFAVQDLSMRGNTSQLAVLRRDIRDMNGEFTLSVRELVAKNDTCVSAEGKIWTDILTRLQAEYDWDGPELSGPLTCENGKLVILLKGINPSGESVTMHVEMGLNATGVLHAEITNAQPDTVRAVTLLGFVQEADALVYDYRIDRF